MWSSSICTASVLIFISSSIRDARAFLVPLSHSFPSIGIERYDLSRQMQSGEKGVLSLNLVSDGNVISSVEPRRQEIREELIRICHETNRGFGASQKERRNVEKVIKDLVALAVDADIQTALQSYNDSSNSENSLLRGKWTLVYTDAPDILTLDSRSPISLSEMGRIGQDCTNPPILQNVIEWKKPGWIPDNDALPARVLQKVTCRGKASSQKKNKVDLNILGARLVNPDTDQELVSENPIGLPFGAFTLLYIDSELRITRTNQNYYAVNTRDADFETEWF
jgi:hypothetical protein